MANNDQNPDEKLSQAVGALIQNFSIIELLVLAWGYALTKDRIVFDHFLKKRQIFAQLELLKQMVNNSDLAPEIKEWFAGSFPEIERLRKIRNTAAHNPNVTKVIGEDPVIKNMMKDGSDELDFEAVIGAKNEAAKIVNDLNGNYLKAFGREPTIETRDGT